MDAEGLYHHIEVGKTDGCSPHLLVPLLGRFKREDGDLMHFLPIANKTRSGTHIWRLVEHLVNILKVEGKQNCPALCDEYGLQLYTHVLELVIKPILRRTQRDKHHKENIAKDLEVEYWIRISRSPKRGDSNESMDQLLVDSVIKLIHRRELYEKNRGEQTGFDMMQHYASGRNTRYKQLQISQCL